MSCHKRLMGIISNSMEEGNNLEITGIPYDVSDENLEEKVIQVLSEIQFNVSSSDMGPSINDVPR